MFHFNQSKVSQSLDEPVFLTKFQSTFVLPTALRQQYGTELITEQLVRVGGLTTDKLPETVEQVFKFHKRRFIGSVVETNVDVEMEFEVNRDKKTRSMYPYNVFRDWTKLGYDANTGFMGFKEDYVGSNTTVLVDKKGNVLREWIFPIFFPITPANPMDLESENESQFRLIMTFAGENETDTSY